MKIEKIKKTKSGKYKIELDDNISLITYDDVILENGLLYNHHIDAKTLNKINIDTKYYDIYNKTVKTILRRLRSEKEIDEYLDKNNVIASDKKKIINELKRIGLVNDITFAQAYVADKINLSNIGPDRIKADLIEHNIADVIIEKELSKFNTDLQNDKINKMLEKKIKTNHKYSSYMFKKKMLDELVNLGYKKELVILNLDNIDIKDDIINKECDKLYNTLSKKYSGYTLFNKLKQKLYQKGFTLSTINEVLDNYDFNSKEDI